MSKNDQIDAVLLASGGLDSTTMAYWLIDQGINFYPLFINYGQHFAETEFTTLSRVLPQKIISETEVLNVADVYKSCKSRLIVEADLWKDTITYNDLFIPYRNLLLLSIGAAFAQSKECSRLYSAFINSSHAQEIDCSLDFFNRLEILLSDYGTIKIIMPFRDLSKYDVAKIGISLGAPIGETFSCQASADIPCGACPNCVDRLDALFAISKVDN